MNVREWALPVYTILMQLAVGVVFMLWSIYTFGMKSYPQESKDRIFRKPLLIIVVTIITAIVGSHFHLSRPYFSFLAILNFRTSWLSREIVFTLMFLLTCCLLSYLVWFRPGLAKLKTALGWLAMISGCAVIFCMSSLYLIPTQPPWNTPVTILSFYATALLLGLTSGVTLLIMDTVFSEAKEPELAGRRSDILRRAFPWIARVVLVLLVVMIALSVYPIVMRQQSGDRLAQTSVELLLGVYGPLFGVQFLALVAGVGLLEFILIWIVRERKPLVEMVTLVYVACSLVVIGEILSRFLFYATHIRIGV